MLFKIELLGTSVNIYKTTYALSAFNSFLNHSAAIVIQKSKMKL